MDADGGIFKHPLSSYHHRRDCSGRRHTRSRGVSSAAISNPNKSFFLMLLPISWIHSDFQTASILPHQKTTRHSIAITSSLFTSPRSSAGLSCPLNPRRLVLPFVDPPKHCLELVPLHRLSQGDTIQYIHSKHIRHDKRLRISMFDPRSHQTHLWSSDDLWLTHPICIATRRCVSSPKQLLLTTFEQMEPLWAHHHILIPRNYSHWIHRLIAHRPVSHLFSSHGSVQPVCHGQNYSP